MALPKIKPPTYNLPKLNIPEVSSKKKSRSGLKPLRVGESPLIPLKKKKVSSYFKRRVKGLKRSMGR